MKASSSDPFDFDASAALKGVSPENALGILFAPQDDGYTQALARAAEKFPFPIVGGTVIGSPFDSGTGPFAGSFGAVAKNGLRRAVAVSDADRNAGAAEQMRRLHSECLEKLGSEAKLFLVLTPIFPDFFIDPFLDELFRLAGNIPVFGGMTSDDFQARRSAVFVDGKAYDNRIVLVALGGDIDPVFGIGEQITVLSDYSPIITEARDNVIVRVDDISFAQYMKKIGFGKEAVDDFPITVRLRHPDGKSDSIRVLVEVNEDDGTGVIDSSARAGSAVSLGFLTKQDILDSTAACLDQLLGAMRRKEEEGYSFSFILAISCVGRYYTLFGQGNCETELLEERLPSGMSRFGFFGLCEVCPSIGEDGVPRNGKHGQTLGLCAF